jgi:hypothetical protein
MIFNKSTDISADQFSLINAESIAKADQGQIRRVPAYVSQASEAEAGGKQIALAPKPQAR